jgi:hypothetical protein
MLILYRTCLSLLYRISAHNLDIKRGRHSNTPSNIGAVEDEIHVLNTCSAYQPFRESFLQKINNLGPYDQLSSSNL